VPVPCEIAGRVEKPRDRDWYRFEAKKGDVLSIEAYGDRLGSPLDLYMILRRPGGPATEYDDNPETLHPQMFFTRSDDPARVRIEAPADGTYLLLVSSREADLQGGPRHIYRVRITAARPDFRLIVMPPAVNTPDAALMGAGGAALYTVLVWRQDGFDGAIALSAEGLPPGVTCPPQAVPAGQKLASLVLLAQPGAAPWTGLITVKGMATIDGHLVERAARSASVSWPVQQGNIAMSRLDHGGLALAVREAAPYTLSAAFDKETAQPGEKLTVKVRLVRHSEDVKGAVTITALGLVQNGPVTFNNNQPLTLAPGKEEATATLDLKAGAPPGPFTLVLRAQTTATVKDAGGRARPNVTLVQATAATVKVVPKGLGDVKVTPQAVVVKAGEEVVVTVKVTRVPGFDGPFQIELAGNDLRGVSAEPVTLAAGKEEVKLVVKAAAGAAQGGRTGLVVKATASLDKVTTTQEGRLSVTVMK
jgi:hypothetical protein